ncbi:hypothetical protein FACS1894181_06830 [Bacteroidia bacterium]|nr:hypothetical protein FACS1894181_06830 [Bacteroidia bacterium]
MNSIIVTTPDELRAIINEAVSGISATAVSNKPQIDTITLSGVLHLLEEHGYPTSKAKMYKLTSAGEIPFKTFGKKLVFSRKEVLEWAENQTKSKHDLSNVDLAFARRAKRKHESS